MATTEREIGHRMKSIYTQDLVTTTSVPTYDYQNMFLSYSKWSTCTQDIIMML